MGKKRERPAILVKETARLYFRQVKKYKLTFFIALFCIPLGVLAIDTLLPYFAGQAIGALTQDGKAAALQMTLYAAVAGGAGALFNFFGFQALLRHESHVTKSLIQQTFLSIIRKDIAFFNNHKTGSMTSNFINFVHAHIQLQDLLLIRTLGFVIGVGSGLIILALNVWPLALLLASFLILLIIQIRWSMKHREVWRTRRRKIRSEIHGTIADAITNNLVVKTFARESSEFDTINTLSTSYQNVFRKDYLFFSAEGSLRVFFMSVVQVVTVLLSVIFVSGGQMNIAIAIFVIAYMQRIGSQLFTLGEMINGYDQAFLDAQPMTEMLLLADNVNDKPNAHKLHDVSGSVKFNDVTYRYPDGTTDVLHNIDLAIPVGQKIGLVGQSGAGKTTIVQLLLRFNDVADGAIMIDNYDIRDISQQSLRENIAYVPQEPMLFHRSLRENIAYGKPGASDEEIVAAAKRANAWEFIIDLPNGLDTTVGERGVKLSGGQRQRIAIARAILKDAPILVLDEATSALDSESEKLIQASLETLMENRTSIVIAHRLSTIAKLDRIIVLGKGRIIEDGTHGQLLKRGGMYAKLWSHQSGGFINE